MVQPAQLAGDSCLAVSMLLLGEMRMCRQHGPHPNKACGAHLEPTSKDRHLTHAQVVTGRLWTAWLSKGHRP